jgi:hypothetical protein
VERRKTTTLDPHARCEAVAPSALACMPAPLWGKDRGHGVPAEGTTRVDQATALGVLISLSAGEPMEHATIAEAGRVAAQSLRRGGTRSLIDPEHPSSARWDLEHLTDEEAAALARLLAQEVPELMEERYFKIKND